MESERKLVKDIVSSKKFKAMVKEPIVRISKHNKTAEAVRYMGDNLLRHEIHIPKVHERAWKFYSMSAAVAETNSEALVLAYTNRSDLLIHINKYKEATVDIDRALRVLEEAETKMDKMEAALLREELEHDIRIAKFMMRMPFIYLEHSDTQSELLNALEKEHPVNDFSSVEIQYDIDNGRHLVATKDIKPGEVIFIEEPYLKFLNVKKLHVHCSYCFKTTWTNIPCDHCSWTMFCSEQCKEKAWEKYHDIECSVYACAKDDESEDTCKQLAIRAIILALKEYGSIDNLKAQLLKWDESTNYKEPFLHDHKLRGNGFRSMYALAGHLNPILINKHKTDAGTVLKSFAKNTTYFGDNFDYSNAESYKDNENVVFLGALYLKLSKISQINSFQMWNNSYKCQYKFNLNFTCWINECCSSGVYIAPVTSLLNHSCFPNANRCYSQDHKVILYAVQPIKKGTQIFHCYQEIYRSVPLFVRQDLLSTIYNFDCKCPACQGKWPELIDHSTDSTESTEYDLLAQAIRDTECKYDPEIIDELATKIEESFENSKQPSKATISVINSLSTLFEKVYGIWLHVNAGCNPFIALHK